MEITDIFDVLWRQYTKMTPQAGRIHELLKGRGDTIRNDHVALRTYGVPGADIEVLERAFVANGYEAMETYEFPEKKLLAYHYEHPTRNLPKVFLSQLIVEEFSPTLRGIVKRLVSEVPATMTARPDLVASGRLWSVSYEDYETLRNESEYAAWVAAFGFCANHFTVDVNALESFHDLAALNAFLKKEGFQLNANGGEIKGSKEVLLEQSSTLADEALVVFSDGEKPIPSCYYEFALRHPTKDGSLYQGFVAASADRIFESTDRR